LILNNKKDKVDNQFKNLLLETLRAVKGHPDSQNGVGFVTEFDEEPDWEVVISFVPKDTLPPTPPDNMH
jgi:hypothetical protein